MNKNEYLKILVVDGHSGWGRYFINALHKKNIEYNIIYISTSKLPLLLRSISGSIDRWRLSRLLDRHKYDAILVLRYEYLELWIKDSINAYYVHRPYRGLDHPVKYYMRYFGKLVNTFLKSYDYRFMKRKNMFVFANSYTTYNAYARFGIPGQVVYYPFDYTQFYSLQNKDTIAVSIGVFSVFKLHEVTLEIARILSNIKFYIIGILNDRKYFNYHD